MERNIMGLASVVLVLVTVVAPWYSQSIDVNLLFGSESFTLTFHMSLLDLVSGNMHFPETTTAEAWFVWVVLISLIVGALFGLVGSLTVGEKGQILLVCGGVATLLSPIIFNFGLRSIGFPLYGFWYARPLTPDTSGYHIDVSVDVGFLVSFSAALVMFSSTMRHPMETQAENLTETKSIEIEAPPWKVWEMLAIDRWTEWNEETQKRVKRVEYTSEIHIPKDRYRVGATSNFVDKHDKLYLACEVTASIENKKIAYRLRADMHPFVRQIAQTFVLEPLETGTRLTCVLNYERFGWGILGRTIIKLMTVRKGIERALENLRTILEKQ